MRVVISEYFINYAKNCHSKNKACGFSKMYAEQTHTVTSITLPLSDFHNALSYLGE